MRGLWVIVISPTCDLLYLSSEWEPVCEHTDEGQMAENVLCFSAD